METPKKFTADTYKDFTPLDARLPENLNHGCLLELLLSSFHPYERGTLPFVGVGSFVALCLPVPR